MTECLADIYAQIKFLDSGATLGNSFYGFLDTYFIKFGPRYVPKKKMIQVLFDKIKPFCIRITNKTLKLPPRIYKKMVVEPTPQQLKLLHELNTLFQLEFGKVKIDTQYIFALIAKSLQICDGFVKDSNTDVIEVVDTNKDAVLLDILDDIDITKNKVLIWCAFRFTVSKLERYLTRLGHNVLTLTGGVKDANSVVRNFQHSKRYNVLVATQKKASDSITLTACRYAIYYSNLWSGGERGNSEARIYRKGSEIHKSIVYTDMLVHGTVEEKVYQCLVRKKNLVDMLKKEFTTITRGA